MAVSPPFTTLPGPPFELSAPGSTFTVSVTVPSAPAATPVIVQFTTPLVSFPLSDALTNSTLESRVSFILISAAVDL